MKSFLIIISLAILSAGSLALANRESGGSGPGLAVFVRFSSFGTGIDEQTLNATLNLIARAKQDDPNISSTQQQMGREGETLVCAKFVLPAAPYQFIKKIAPLIRQDANSVGEKRTSVLIGETCENVDEATEQNIDAY